MRMRYVSQKQNGPKKKRKEEKKEKKLKEVASLTNTS